MHRIVAKELDRLAGLCAKHRVRRLALFGSAAGDRLDPRHSDIDVLVEFEPMPPTERAEAWFGLHDDLARLFGLPVDLVERDAIRNPYFREAVEESQIELYHAA